MTFAFPTRRAPSVRTWGIQVGLLVFPILLLVVGLVELTLTREERLGWSTLTGAGLFAAALLAASIWTRWRVPLADPLLLPIAAVLASLGQLMTSRLEPAFGSRQGVWVLIGLAGLVVITCLPSAGWLRRYRYTWATLGLLLLVATLVFGTDPNGSGARLWLVLGPVNLQPMELVKLLLVVFLAAYLEEHRELLADAGRRIGPLWLPPLPYLAPILLMAGAALAIFVIQVDLGPALLLSTVVLLMLYMASGRATYVLLGGLLLIGAGFAAARLFTHVQARVATWLDPFADPQGASYQIVQALYAFGTGGVFGTGLDLGSPRYIPAVHTDFVIAAIGEELGLVGTLAVVALFVLLTVRGFRVALRSRSGFNSLLAGGLTSVLGLQALIILAGTLRLIPLTGITLPFVSYGGSSVVANFLLVGLLLLISDEEERLAAPMQAASTTEPGLPWGQARFAGPTRRAGSALLAGFLAVAVALGYWQVWRGPELASDPANPRIATARLTEPRGRILDSQGAVLAWSEQTPDGTERRYADPSLVHTIGFHSARFGDTNLEAAYDAQLRGVRSPSPLDRIAALLFPQRQVQPDDLVITVDRRINDAAIAALGNSDGAIVALDPKTGAVLALASKPYFDPNQSDDALAKLQDDPSQPLFNRAVQATYVPGSTFKAITASAALDLGLVDLNQPFNCTTAVMVGSYSIDCKNNLAVAPRPTYKQAFAWSSNRTFGLTGMLLGFLQPGQLNPWLDDHPPGPYPWTRPGASIQPSADRLVEHAEQFGFDRTIPFDFTISPSQVKRPSTEWTPELLVQTAFGQGELEATPMQMALVAAAIANDGKVPSPYLAAELRSPSGATQQLHTPGETYSNAMSASTAHTMVDFMVEGVQNGYAAKAAIPGVKVGGKTGTAEVGDGTSHSWFIGFAPADNPTVAVAVIMEHQGSGSDFATPAGKQVLQAALSGR